MANIKVFIAGSLALENDRDAVRSALVNVGISYERHDLSITSYTCENFKNYINAEGRQVDYNKFIEETADYLIIIMNEDLHPKTLEEFECARRSYLQYNRPKIFVYNNTSVGPGSATILELKKKMKELNQYWTDYIDGQLKLLVENNFSRELLEMVNAPHRTIEDEKKEKITAVTSLYGDLSHALKAVASMVQTLVDDGCPVFKKQVEAVQKLKYTLHVTKDFLPQKLYNEAFDIAVEYIETAYNWVLGKIRTDMANGVTTYSQQELIAMHEVVTCDLIPLDEVQGRIDAFRAKLADYLDLYDANVGK